MKIVALALLSFICSHVETFGQHPASDILTTARQQLEKARAENSDSTYRQAEDAFTSALESDAGNIDALIGRGEARIARGLIAFAGGRVGSGTALFTAGSADLDEAVALAPAQLNVRLTRGWTYGVWPAYVGKAGVAREDLEQAVTHPEFGRLSADQRARVSGAGDRLCEFFRNGQSPDFFRIGR